MHEDHQLPVTLHTGCEILYTDASPHLLKEGHHSVTGGNVDSAGGVLRRRAVQPHVRGRAALWQCGIHGHLRACGMRFDPMRNFAQHVRELREEYGQCICR